MKVNNYLQTLRASHPFSALMASSVLLILLIRMKFSIYWIVTSLCVIILVQLATGMINDYRDFEKDQKYQQYKPLVREKINHSDLKIMIYIFGGLIIIMTFTIFPLRVILLILGGAGLAQLYNYGMKDTPLSIVVFSTSFGMMALLPFLLRTTTCYLCDVSPTFLITGGIVTAVLHIANCQIDLETDQTRGSRNFVIFLGKKYLSILLVVLLLTLSIMYSNLIVIVIVEIVAIGLVIFEILVPMSVKKHEIIYYIAIICNLVVFIKIPILAS